jgi:hypothetical protein
VSYTRVISTEIKLLSGMKSCRDDLIARTKTGRGCFVLASVEGGWRGAKSKDRKKPGYVINYVPYSLSLCLGISIFIRYIFVLFYPIVPPAKCSFFVSF